MHKDDQKCRELIEITANAFGGGVVDSLMLRAVQRDNLEISIMEAVER